MDASGSGLKHRTAWAGKGDGVLFYDADNDGLISDDREYIFTEWGERRKTNGPVDRFGQRTREAQGTAGDDLAALRSRFDTNGDGKLSGAELSGFKVMVTTDNGTLVTRKFQRSWASSMQPLLEDRVALGRARLVEGGSFAA